MEVRADARPGKETEPKITIAVIRKLSFLIGYLLSERVSDPTGDPAIHY
jgi:hypothetical protein